MLVALILSTLGASRDMIIRDYVKSAETWVNGPYHLRADYSAKLEHSGLTPNTWLGASADVMESSLSYIDEKFGSTEAYLARYGRFDCRSLALSITRPTRLWSAL
jgi:Tyrosine phosphatase family